MRSFLGIAFCFAAGFNFMAIGAEHREKWLPLKVSDEDISNASILINAPGMDITMIDAFNQTRLFGGSVDYMEAIILALLSFISDDTDDESPLRLSYEEEGDRGKEQLIQRMKQGSVLGILSQEQLQDPVIGPKREVDISKSWVFYLHLEDLDFTFWAIVHRFGQEATYNYGFN